MNDDRWWGRARCVECGKLVSVQHWGGKDYRVTCSCGFSVICQDPSGHGTWEEAGASDGRDI